MKILCFIDSLGAGGAQRQIVTLATLLRSKGYDTSVCTYHDLDFYKQYLDDNNVPNTIIQGASRGFMRILRVRSYFKKENPDCVIAYQESPSILACIARLMGCKYHLIVSERNTTQIIGWNERIRFQLYRIADAVVPNSFTQAYYLEKHYPWMKKKIHTISNCVDLEKYHPVDHSKSIIPEIIVAASMWKSKNARGLIHACQLLKEQFVKVHFSWYGINDEVTEYEKNTLDLVTKLNVSDYIQFYPKTKTIEDKYLKADYLCLPSFYEGTPNVICEAMASGLPVICSDVCDNGLYVTEGVNGFLFNPHNPTDIAAKIKSAIILTDEEYQQYRRNSRSKAELKLSKELFLEKYESIINCE